MTKRDKQTICLSIYCELQQIKQRYLYFLVKGITMRCNVNE